MDIFWRTRLHFDFRNGQELWLGQNTNQDCCARRHSAAGLHIRIPCGHLRNGLGDLSMNLCCCLVQLWHINDIRVFWTPNTFTSFSVHKRNYLYKLRSKWLSKMPLTICWSITWLYVRLAKLKLLVSRRAHSSQVLSQCPGGKLWVQRSIPELHFWLSETF